METLKKNSRIIVKKKSLAKLQKKPEKYVIGGIVHNQYRNLENERSTLYDPGYYRYLD